MDADMSHVLNVLSSGNDHVKQEDVAGGKMTLKVGDASPMSDDTAPSDDEAEKKKKQKERGGIKDDSQWSEVLDMLAAASEPHLSQPSGSGTPHTHHGQQSITQEYGQFPEQANIGHHKQMQSGQSEHQAAQQDDRQQQGPGHGIQTNHIPFLGQSNQLTSQAFVPVLPGIASGIGPGHVMAVPQHSGSGDVMLSGGMVNMAGPQTVSQVPPPGMPASGPGLEELFSSFGMPQAPPVTQVSSGALAAAAASAMGMEGTAQMSEEAIREAVLTETLARLLREKTGGGPALPPWRRGHSESLPATDSADTRPREMSPADSSPPSTVVSVQAPAASTAFASDPRLSTKPSSIQPSQDTSMIHDGSTRPAKEEAPLDKFIKIFGLDELAASCLMKLQDDEAAFVIESCQNRLKYAKNPSAVVMIAIKGVAAKVGRRYYGSRETGEGDKSKGQSGELQMFEGSPVAETVEEDPAERTEAAETDPYLLMAAPEEEEYLEEEEEEDEKAADEEVEIEDSVVTTASEAAAEHPAKRQRTSMANAPSSSERLLVEVLPGTHGDERVEDDDDEAALDSLFFVDTGNAVS